MCFIKSLIFIIPVFLFAGCRSFDGSVANQKRVIAVQPLEEVSDSTLQYLKQSLQDSLGLNVILLASKPLPPSAWYAPHKRYWADSLLIFLRKPYKDHSDTLILGVTGKDISTSLNGQTNRGVMGLAYVNGRSAVISDYRLHEYGRSRDSIDYYFVMLALHELGHNLGLPHCLQEGCLMEDAEVKGHITTLRGYCIACRQLIDNAAKAGK